MALDIAKLGRKPYQKLEQPREGDASGAHIRRYFSAFFGRIVSVLLLAGTFLVPAWPWDFGASSGFGRHAAWLALSGALGVSFAWHALFSREFSETPGSSRAREHRTATKLAFVLVVAFGIGSFARLGFWGALGFGALGTELSWLGTFFGALWFLAIRYSRGTVEAVKQLLVGFFLGSTALAGYSLYALVFGGGYAAAEWVVRGGMLLTMALAAFLMLAFAMFQKRWVKLLWTAAILLHLAALFAWDAKSVWLLLAAGISTLLLFQIAYSKKLWQRNFIYPLQIWAIVVLLLLIPVKVFTSLNVPRDSLVPYAGAREAVLRQGFTLFGDGLGSADRYALFSGISFEDFGSLGATAAPVPAVGHGYVRLYLEAGSVGVAAWVLFLVFVLAFGIRFWRRNLQAFKEGTMSEGAYLGAVALVALAMLMGGLWFSVFSFFVYWFSMLLAAFALLLWHPLAPKASESASPRPPALPVATRYPFSWPPSAALAFVTLAYVAFLVVGARVVSAPGAAAAFSAHPDAGTRVLGFREAARRNPWNGRYRLQEARALLDLLGTPISIDAQREALERITAILSREAESSGSPITHWLAAGMYADLEAYAEGSSALARAEYRAARLLAPKNVALPVAVSAFYRSHVDALVAGGVSAAELRLEARDALAESLSVAPDYVPARLELAFFLEEEEGVARALSELAPWEDASPEIAYHIGRLYFNEGELEKASEKFLEVVRSVPSHSNARYSLGVAYFRLEKYPEALREFQEVLAMNPGTEDVQAKIDQVQKLIK